MKIIKHVLLISIAVFAASYFVEGVVVNPFWVSLIAGAVLTVINFLVKPIIKILTLPINIITLGLFSIVINAGIFWFIGNGDLIKGFSVNGWEPALYGSIIVSVITWLGDKIFGSKED